MPHSRSTYIRPVKPFGTGCENCGALFTDVEASRACSACLQEHVRSIYADRRPLARDLAERAKRIVIRELEYRPPSSIMWETS